MDEQTKLIFSRSILNEDGGKDPEIRANVRALNESGIFYDPESKDPFERICIYAIAFYMGHTDAPTERFMAKHCPMVDPSLKATEPQMYAAQMATNPYPKLKGIKPAIGKEFKQLLDELKEEYKLTLLDQVASKARHDILNGEDSDKILLEMKVRAKEVTELTETFATTVVHNDPDTIEAQHQEYTESGNRICRLTGLYPIDAALHGFRPGELVLIYGAVGGGKSTFAEQIAITSAYVTGHNVLYVSLEMGIDKVRRDINLMVANQMIAQPADFGLTEADVANIKYLDATDYEFGALTDEQEKFLFDVALPWLSSADKFGQLKIIAPNVGMDIIDFTTRLDYEIAEFESRGDTLDLIVIDYIALLDPVRTSRMTDWYSALTQIIKDVKRYALRRRIPIVSPFQVNRKSAEEAEKKDKDGGAKGFGLTSGSQSAEAEKSADIIISLQRDEDGDRVSFQCLKNRRGSTRLGPDHSEETASCIFRPEHKLFLSDEPVEIEDVFGLVECDL